ncbi:Crp/Fnr family transcriptional regulator [Sphingomonas radiodurans]|uniref:Crp/Fnr family transcriptional regulator n=1 Tax=Sphingomonas radiodurans TaxID=2890321 RepID=UPI001E63F39D|nr:Crp/Fnr family transcriptional regulator [Sphingomonas radiodurans]WBH17594.1 Crp/Fnr family transcriptional regulator [Sphingomonas radiodurans]
MFDQLLCSRWFARQPRQVQEALATAGRSVTLSAGQWVYGEGDETTGLVVVTSGMLRLEAAVGDRTILVGVAIAGGAFGQSQRRGGGPRIVTARAGPASQVVTIGDAALERIGADLPVLWRAVSELVYGQLDASVHGLAQMLALPPRGRIAARLLLFAERGEAPLSQNDLAELCGLSRKSTNAHLAALEAEGMIRRGYGSIRLLDKSRLANLPT